MEIKKDKKGLVFIQGAVVKDASNAKELNALFEEGSKNRHTASTSKHVFKHCIGYFYIVYNFLAHLDTSTIFFKFLPIQSL